MADAIDHGRAILGAIFTRKSDEALGYALAHLTPEHFTDNVQAALFAMCARYHDQAGAALPRPALASILRAQAPGTVAKYEEYYDLCCDSAADGEEYRWPVQQLRELHAERVTGEAITTAMEILTRGKQDGQRELKGHADARAYLSTALVDAGAQDGEPSSWQPRDLSAIATGDRKPLQPSVGARADGLGLFYPGKIHALGAEPEAAKTWLMLEMAAQEIEQGNYVVFVDFEDDEFTITVRLLATRAAFRARPGTVLRLFHYIRPEEPLFRTEWGQVTWRSHELARLLADVERLVPTLAVFDGVTEALALHGLNGDKGYEVAHWLTEVLRPVARRGPAVVQLDHVVKDRESRGRWDTGSQHKLAGISGASYTLVRVKPFGIGMEGASDLYIRKDKPAGLRRHGRPAKDGMALLGRFTLASDEDGTAVQAAVGLPPEAQDRDRPTFVMERVSNTLGELQARGQGPFSQRSVELAVKGDDKVVRVALEALVLDSYVQREDGRGRAKLHTLIRRFPGGEPVSDLPTAPSP